MVMGGSHETGVTADVQSGGVVTVIDNASTLEVKLPTEQSAVTSIILEDKDGKQVPVTVSAGVAEVPTMNFEAEEGDELQYFYKKSITGTKFTIDAAKFASKCKITYRTLSYSVDTEAVYSDIWWEFPSVTSDGNFDLTMTAGEAMAPTMTFVATAPRGNSELGIKYEQLRV